MWLVLPLAADSELSICRNLKVQFELTPHGRTETVEKLAELRACNVVLHISGVEVVCNIDNSHTEACASSAHFGDALWYAETLRSLHS